jgi:hypothetical protein
LVSRAGARKVPDFFVWVSATAKAIVFLRPVFFVAGQVVCSLICDPVFDLRAYTVPVPVAQAQLQFSSCRLAPRLRAIGQFFALVFWFIAGAHVCSSCCFPPLKFLFIFSQRVGQVLRPDFVFC